MTLWRCPPDALHRAWDNGLPPALVVDPGDTVTFATVDASDGAVDAPPWATPLPPSGGRGLRSASGRGHPMCGPITVRGARPGDTLVVDVVEIIPQEWGWTGFRPGGGVLGDAFAEGARVLWDLRGERAVPWAPATDSGMRPLMAVRAPQGPFCGVMGVAPAEAGEHATTPPRSVGGNLDVRGLVAGSALFLPVAVDGALFSVGDVHAAQGDGEICGTGIECAATVTLRFDLRRGRRLASPEYRTPQIPLPGPRYGVTGVAPDLMEATRQAVRGMIAYLGAEHGLVAADAYILCSVAVDLTISEVVDPPNWVVSALLPLDIF